MFGSCIRSGTHPNRRLSLCSDTESDSCRKNAFLRTRLLMLMIRAESQWQKWMCCFGKRRCAQTAAERYDEGCFLRNFVFLIFRTKPSQLVFRSRKHRDGHGCRFVSMKPFLRNSKSLLYDFSFEWVSRSELCKFRNRRIKTAVHVRSDCFSFLYRSTSKLSIYSRRFQIIASLDCCAKKTSNN